MRRVIESDKKKQKMVNLFLNLEYLNFKTLKVMCRIRAWSQWFTN